MSRGTKVFIVRKLLEIVLTSLIVTMISFGLMKLSPVDAAEAYLQRNQSPITAENLEKVREEMGLNRPLPVQYGNWLINALRGDFGRSYVNSKDVLGQELSALAFTSKVILLAGVFEAALIVLIGCLCYLGRNRISGHVISALCFAAISIPPFFLASQYIDVIVVRLGIGSVVGNTGIMRYLPAALCFVPGTSAFFGPLFATNIAAQMSLDSADYARCRGLSEGRILLYHAVPSALVSIIPSFFQMLALNLAGAIVIEQIFSIPGLGYLVMTGVTNRDPPVIHATILLLALSLSLFNILADVIRRVISHSTDLLMVHT